MTDEGQLSWRVAYCKPRQEAMANHRLQQLGYETLFLHYITITRHARKTRQVVRAYFPRYLFVGLRQSQGLWDISNAQGVSTVVSCGERPLSVPQAVINELCARGDANGLVDEVDGVIHRLYAAGQHIKVSEGPFAGLLGTIEVDEGKQVQVWLSDLKRGLRVTFDRKALSPDVAAR